MHSIPRLPFHASDIVLRGKLPLPKIQKASFVTPYVLPGADAPDGVSGQPPQYRAHRVANFDGARIMAEIMVVKTKFFPMWVGLRQPG